MPFFALYKGWVPIKSMLPVSLEKMQDADGGFLVLQDKGLSVGNALFQHL